MNFFSYAVATLLLGCSTSVCSQVIKLIRPIDALSSAAILYDSGKFSEAIAVVKTIPERDTAYTDMLSQLAYSYIGLKEFDKAIAICQERLKESSEERTLFLKIQAIATEKKGDYQNAVTLFENAIKAYPTDISLIFNLGLIQYNNKDYEKAEDNFFKVLGLNPFHTSSHLNLARLKIGQGRKVHAMFAMGMYLGISEKDNSNLVRINNFLDNQITDEGTLPSFGQNAFTKLDQMIRARIVKEEGFKSVFQVTAPVVQQYELLFDQMNSIATSTDDRYVNFYLPVYKSIKENNGVEAFVYHILTSSSIETAAKWRNKNEKALNTFFNVTNTALKKHRENVTIGQFGFKTPINAWYNNNNQLTAVGNAQNDKRFGHWIFLHSNSEKSAEGDYNDIGVKVGTWKYFHKNGTIKSVENYETGEVTVYAANGKKKEHFFLKDDKIEGGVELFYEAGPIKEKLKFAAGQREGKSVLYFGDGTLKASYEYKNGQPEGDYIINYENGKIKERCSYKNNLLHGKYEFFHINGLLSVIGEYSNNYQVGPWKYYYSNGKLQRMGTYAVKGIPVGEWIYYDELEQIVEKRSFDNEGRYQGDITYYDDGKLFCTSTYKKDVIIKDTFYDDQGKAISSSGSNEGTFYSKNFYSTGELRSEGNNQKGKAEGSWKFYNRYGRLISEYFYKDNGLEGKAKDYYPSGEKKIECEYKDGKLHGYYQEYYRNGKLKQEGWYQDGNKEQVWLTYYQDGTIESDYYYLKNSTIGKGYNYALDGKKYSEIETDDEGLSNLQYFNSQGVQTSVKRTEKFTDVYEEFYKNKKPKSRYDVLCGSYSRSWESYFPDGTIHYKYEIVNGRKNGKYISFEINGNISTTGMYEGDMREGPWKSYHENGKLYSEGNYLNNERDSIWTFYYGNGNISSRAYYENDKRDGIVTYFGLDGTAILEKLFANGDLIAYRPVGRVDKSEWIKFSGNGKIEAHYSNGNKAFEEEYKNGLAHSYDRVYYPTGKLFNEYQYDNGDLTGEFKIYYPSGKLKEKGSYKDDELEGKVEVYQEDGVIERTITYKMGYRHGKAILYNKGVKQKEFNFWNGTVED